MNRFAQQVLVAAAAGALLVAGATRDSLADPTPATATVSGGDVAGTDWEARQPQFEPVGISRIVVRVPARRGDEQATWIVQFEEAPLATFSGGTPAGATRNMAPTSPRARGEARLNPKSVESRAYLEFLSTKQSQRFSAIENALKRAPEVRYTYRAAFNGMALELTADEAERIAGLPGIKRVRPEIYRYIETDRGPTFIGADQVWNGSFGDGASTRGAGVVVAVLDSGLNMKSGHPSFAELGGDGYQVVNPLGPGNYRGRCNAADPDYDADLQCNGKVIGAYSYTSDDTPEDENGHGSHVTGTAAGNVVNGVEIPNTTLTVDVSGVAPRANIVVYDVCRLGECPTSAIVAALDQVVMDVDVIDIVNYSIGGASSDPWSDADSLGLLAVREAGIFVATSAGNSGPFAGTVGSPADAPWITTVADQTHDRIIADNALSVTGPGTVPPGLIDIPALEGRGPALVTAPDAPIGFDDANTIGCEAFATDTFTGEIALIERGECSFATKINNASDAGAVAAVIYNNIPGAAAFSMSGLGSTTIPAVMITNADGIAVRDWITGNLGATALLDPDFRETFGDPAVGDLMNADSSRGPNPATGNILKPDVSAPGTNILAAVSGGANAWALATGTSMASPHVAGSAALVRALHPDWTPAEIHSALVMRARAPDSIFKEDGVTPSDPFDRGSGRVSPPGAASALLVMDETAAAFEEADPAQGGDPTSLNLPQLAAEICIETCGWSRTFTMVDDGMLPEGTPVSSAWSIDFVVPAGVTASATPAQFTLNAGESQTVVFEADVSDATLDEWRFGRVEMNLDQFEVDPGGVIPGSAGYQQIPMAMKRSPRKLPQKVEIATGRDHGSRLFDGLETRSVTDLQVESTGLVRADELTFELDQDPTSDDPFDDLDQVFAKTVDVPPGARALIAMTDSRQSPNVELYVQNVASGTVVCEAVNPGSAERCAVETPDAGQYRIVVQNGQGSTSQPDSITLADVIVPAATASNPTLSASGPGGGIAAGTPWALRIFFDLPPGAEPGRWFGELALGSDTGQAGNIGFVPVELTRSEDDVVKRADRSEVGPGDAIRYTVSVAGNVSTETLAYQVDDLIPDGLTLVPGSIQVDRGTVERVGREIQWQFEVTSPELGYTMTTRAEDAACSTGFGYGGYVDLQDFNIRPADLNFDEPDPSILDSVAFPVFGQGAPIDLYGKASVGIAFTDDGFLISDPSSSLGTPWLLQAIPDPDAPNNIVAALWQDLEIVNDPDNFKGVSLAQFGEQIIIVEYDDVRPHGGDGSVTWDFEIIMRRTPDDTPGVFEVVLAYDNLSPITGPVTIGLENADGTAATALVNNAVPGDALDDSTVICFDRALMTSGAEMSYRATVAAPPAAPGSMFVNQAVHMTDNIGDEPGVSDSELLYSEAPDMLFWNAFE